VEPAQILERVEVRMGVIAGNPSSTEMLLRRFGKVFQTRSKIVYHRSKHDELMLETSGCPCNRQQLKNGKGGRWWHTQYECES
jgi:hypothetical protein